MKIFILVAKYLTKIILTLFRVPPFHIVSGANSSHFFSLMQLINSSKITLGSTSNITVYDLGFSKEEKTKLLLKFPNVELKRFPYEDYPAFFNIEINAGEYAWKPVIIDQELIEKKKNVIWLDAGCFIFDDLWFYQFWTWRVGFYSPFAIETIGKWTHPATIQKMNVGSAILRQRNLTGGIVAVSYQSKKAKKMICKWKDYALDKSVIAPEGSDRSNHRQDQSLLGILFYSRYKKIPFYGRSYGVKTNADID